MTNVVRYEPWSVMPRLQDEINRLFSAFGMPFDAESSAATVSWVPATDIHEYPDRFELYVDLPGVDADKVELTLHDGVLTIQGERAPAARAAESGSGETPEYRRMERGLGRFYRRFVLPDTADSDNVKATGRNGVLTITIPKQAKALPRRIQIAA
jgi:HSP20 family protein